MGLRQDILKAESNDAIKVLMNKGANFRWASARTIRSWGNAATRRRKELKAD